MLYQSESILRRVPKEIFSIIFELGVEPGCIEVLRTICLTCRSWYSLATSLPSLWRFIYIKQDTSPKKTALWIERSRSKPLSISVIVPDIHNHTPVDSPRVYSTSSCAILLREFQRWQTVLMDCANTGDIGESLRGEWDDLTKGMNAVLLESLELKMSGLGSPVPLTCTYPRLRSLRLDRRGCHWADPLMERAAATLTSLTIANVGLTDSFTITRLHNGLRYCQNLEELRMDEISWDIGEQQDNTIITLPHLRTLALIAIPHLEPFIRLLRLPKLVELVAGDIEDHDLAFLFIHLAQNTVTVQKLTTGFWDEISAIQIQMALSSFIAMQHDLRSLVVHNAWIDDELIDRLVPSQDNSVAPQLERLGVPTGNISDSKLLSMVQSRHSASLTSGPIKRLKHLVISERELSDTVIQNLLLYVDKVEVEDLLSENDEL